MRRRLRKLGLFALGSATVVAGVVVYLVVLGGYDVAATTPHLRTTVWLLDTTMRNAVRARSGGIDPPPLDDQRRIDEGAAVYREHCESCHGGPGVAPAPFALGLVPLPANLAHTARDWPPRWIYWTIRHGIKMTGMPAWQYRLEDDEIWSVVAFLRVMATMTPSDYRALPSPERADERVAALRRPDPERGRHALPQFGCPMCHLIPGTAAPRAPVGPSLDGIGRRRYIAGALPNTHENLARWLREPQRIHPRSAMPTLGLTGQDAADIAAYLLTLD